MQDRSGTSAHRARSGRFDGAPSAPWRAPDDALLCRLEDEALLERVWVALAGKDAAPLHRRAAGVFAQLRETADGAAALERAVRDDLEPLLRMLREPVATALSPRLAHHLALLHGRLATALGRDADRLADAERAHLRALSMWLWLGHERAYLEDMSRAVTGGALSGGELSRQVTEAPLLPIQALGDCAKRGSRTLAVDARIALRVLRRVDSASERAGCPPELARRAAALAKRARNAAIDDAILRVDQSLDDALLRQAPAGEIVALLNDGVAVWAFSERDELVERFLVRRITPLLWDLYREKRWDDVRAILAPLIRPVEHMAKSIEGDPTKLAYAAPCAQMFVFRAEVAKAFDEQMRLVERALSLCGTHRNGRLVMADLLAERATRELDMAKPWSTGDALSKAAADVLRAQELYPQLKRLEKLKQRLASMGRDIDA